MQLYPVLVFSTNIIDPPVRSGEGMHRFMVPPIIIWRNICTIIFGFFFRTEWDYIARTRTVQTHFIGAPMNLKENTRSAHKRPPFFFISGTLRRPSHRQVRTTWWEVDSPDKDPHATTKAQLQALESAAGANDDEPPRRRIKYMDFIPHARKFRV